MSYTPVGVDIWGAIGSAIQKAAPVAEIGSAVLDDPFLPQTACEVKRLSKAQAGINPGPPCAKTVSSSTKGIGLRYAVGPLRAYVFHRQYPFVVPVAVALALGGLYYAGYLHGKGRK